MEKHNTSCPAGPLAHVFTLPSLLSILFPFLKYLRAFLYALILAPQSRHCYYLCLASKMFIIQERCKTEGKCMPLWSLLRSLAKMGSWEFGHILNCGMNHGRRAEKVLAAAPHASKLPSAPTVPAPPGPGAFLPCKPLIFPFCEHQLGL